HSGTHSTRSSGNCFCHDRIRSAAWWLGSADGWTCPVAVAPWIRLCTPFNGHYAYLAVERLCLRRNNSGNGNWLFSRHGWSLAMSRQSRKALWLLMSGFTWWLIAFGGLYALQALGCRYEWTHHRIVLMSATIIVLIPMIWL